MDEEENLSDPGDVNKTAGKIADAVSETNKSLRAFGAFFSSALEEVVGASKDNLQVWRFKRRIILRDNLLKFMHERGMESLTKEIAPSILLPLIESATLEDDPYLQETWARMLVNAGDENCPVEARTAFGKILNEMSAEDVQNLAQIFEAHKGTSDGYVISPVDSFSDNDYEISIENIIRLGCMRVAQATFSVRSGGRALQITRLGEAFITACTYE